MFDRMIFVFCNRGSFPPDGKSQRESGFQKDVFLRPATQETMVGRCCLYGDSLRNFFSPQGKLATTQGRLSAARENSVCRHI